MVENPSCLQTTSASGVSQPSSQTVPHSLVHTSTRPSLDAEPPTSLIPPLGEQL